eukprot:Clim_evm3s29 gene=Clim_evmTU3s29
MFKGLAVLALVAIANAASIEELNALSGDQYLVDNDDMLVMQTVSAVPPVEDAGDEDSLTGAETASASASSTANVALIAGVAAGSAVLVAGVAGVVYHKRKQRGSYDVEMQA